MASHRQNRQLNARVATDGMNSSKILSFTCALYMCGVFRDSRQSDFVTIMSVF